MLSSKARCGPDANVEWLRSAEGVLYCQYCRALNRKLFPNPINVALRTDGAKDWSIGVPFRADLPIYSRELIAQLGIDRLSQDFCFGQCICDTGQVINEIVTMYSPQYVLLRGDRNTTIKVCGTCGEIWTDLVKVFPGRPAYVMRHQLGESGVFQGRGAKLFVTRKLIDRVEWSRFPDVTVRCIDVRITPLDGRELPGDPASL